MTAARAILFCTWPNCVSQAAYFHGIGKKTKATPAATLVVATLREHEGTFSPGFVSHSLPAVRTLSSLGLSSSLWIPYSLNSPLPSFLSLSLSLVPRFSSPTFYTAISSFYQLHCPLSRSSDFITKRWGQACLQRDLHLLSCCMSNDLRPRVNYECAKDYTRDSRL